MKVEIARRIIDSVDGSARSYAPRGGKLPSSFGWLDSDEKHREKMLELIRMLQDPSSVDELGIGAVRDAFSDRFFPGTSVLHTRAKYFFFVPWCIDDVTRHGWSAEKAQAALKKREIKFIDSLLAGGEKSGVIGRVAKNKLKNMPSSAYWAGLHKLRIRRWDGTIQGHLHRASRLSRGTPDVVDADSGDVVSSRSGFDLSLPGPSDDWLAESSFALTRVEGNYLRDKIAATEPSSVFAWLALNGSPSKADSIWEHPLYPRFPSEMQSEIDHARRFHYLMHGAAVLYNLLLARASNSDSLTERYEETFDEWEGELASSMALDGWDLLDFWHVVGHINSRAAVRSRGFVNRWFDICTAGDQRTDVAAELIRNREYELKRVRSRLVNKDALNQWKGSAGMARLNYRWSVASRHLDDIYRATDAGA